MMIILVRTSAVLRWLGVAALLVTAACGAAPGPGAQVSPTSSATPSARTSPKPIGRLTPPASGPLMVFLTDYVGTANPATAIVLLDSQGHQVARVATHVPLWPQITNGANTLPPPIYIAAGAVYWIDTTGAMRRMDAHGNVSNVTSFSLSSQQQIRFAVSPDGKQVMASLLTVPPFQSPPPSGGPFFARDPNSVWINRTYLAAVGGTPKLVAEVDHKTGNDGVPNPTEIVGWDSTGPVATLGTKLASQAVQLGWLTADSLVHLGLDGTHLGALGGNQCQALDYVMDGSVLCLDLPAPGPLPYRFSVRSTSGVVQWAWTNPVCEGAYRVSPDGNRVMGWQCILTHTSTASGARVNPPDNMNGPYCNPGLVGWYTSDYAIAYAKGPTDTTGICPNTRSNQFQMVSADDPQLTYELGVGGYYAGAVAST